MPTSSTNDFRDSSNPILKALGIELWMPADAMGGPQQRMMYKDSNIVEAEIKEALNQRLMTDSGSVQYFDSPTSGSNLLYLKLTDLDGTKIKAVIDYLKQQGVNDPIVKDTSVAGAQKVIAIKPADHAKFLEAIGRSEPPLRHDNNATRIIINKGRTY